MLRSVLFGAFLGAISVLGVKCGPGSKCPQDAPCCSQYNECGTGAFCLGGCNPRLSFSLDACVPAPVCQDRKLKMGSLDRVADIGDYLGDSSKTDWVAQGEPKAYKDNTLLTMPKDSVGTIMSSTVYMWYGNVKARMKTSRGRGVVTAFILFSGIQDEIDYEWIGVDLETTQTNFYFQGIPNYKNSGNISVSDSFAEFHDYEIRWTPEKIEWLIDGKVGRTQEKKDTWNETSQSWGFPQTPSRVQLSLWPGGKDTNPQGTIDWAGGKIDWDAPDIKNNGYFYATISDVEIECYKTDKAPGTNDKTSYIYTDARGTNDTIVDSDKKTILASLQATGLDMDKGKKKDKPKSSASSSSSSSSSSTSGDDSKETAATIPGGSSGGSGQKHDEGDGGNGGSGNSGGSSSSTPADTKNCDTGSFNQKCGSGESTEGSNGGKSGSTRSSASALAIIIAGCALFWL